MRKAKKNKLVKRMKELSGLILSMVVGLALTIGVGVLAYSGGQASQVIENVENYNASCEGSLGGVYEHNKQFFYGGFDAEGALGFDKGNITLNESSGSYDLRVESNGNAYMLLVDGSADKVGVGTSTPATVLDVYSSASTTLSIDSSAADKGGCLKLQDVDGAGFSYGTVLNGSVTWSTVSCE